VKIFEVGQSHGGLEIKRQTALLEGHSGPVYRVAWAHPKFKSLLASCSFDGRVVVWVKDGRRVTTHENKHPVLSLDWAPVEYGLTLLAGDEKGNVLVLRYDEGSRWSTDSIKAHSSGAAVAWQPAVNNATVMDGKEVVERFVSAGEDGLMRIWEGAKGKFTRKEEVSLGFAAKLVSWVPCWDPSLTRVVVVGVNNCLAEVHNREGRWAVRTLREARKAADLCGLQFGFSDSQFRLMRHSDGVWRREVWQAQFSGAYEQVEE
jgi:protein transport protein SEC13